MENSNNLGKMIGALLIGALVCGLSKIPLLNNHLPEFFPIRRDNNPSYSCNVL